MATSETIVAPDSARVTEDVRYVHIRRIICCLGIAVGAVYAYSFRFLMSPDGIGYLDVASAYLRHDWTVAVNGWWSPAYCWILAIFLRVFSPATRTEYPLVHLVAFLCFAFASWSFYLFWEALRSSVRETNAELAGLTVLTPLAVDLFVYGLFFLLFLPLIALPTPDVLASAFVFLIAHRLLLRLETRESITWGDGIVLGLWFALAYLSKGILFYFSIVALATAILTAGTKSRKPLFISALVFAVLISPWVIVLHRSFGVWTLGFTGQLNYAWFVNGTETDRFLEPNGSPLPYFPGSVVFSQPTIYKVQTQPYITYVPWYDAARFYRVRRAHFQLQGQMAAIKKNLTWLRTWLLVTLGPVSVAVISLLLGSGIVALTAMRRYVAIAAPALVIFAMYVMVLVRTPRYIAAITVLLFAIVLASVRFGRSNTKLLRGVLAAGLAIWAITNLPAMADVVAAVSNGDPDSGVEAAEALGEAGIHENAHVAIVAPAIYSYWARLAKVNVAAEMWNDGVPLFWSAEPVRRHQMLCAMGNAGASVVVGIPPPNTNIENWKPLGRSGYWMYQLSEQQCTPK